MKQIIIRTILSVLFIISVVSPLAADEPAVYKDMEHGFSLSYPKNWEKRESGDEVELYSSEEFSATYKDGIMFGVYCYTADEKLTPEQVLRKRMNVEEEFLFEKFKDRELAGQAWAYTASFNKEKDIKAEFYVCTRGTVIYVLAFGFTPSAKAPQFYPAINGILNSFAFLNPEQTSSGEAINYENKELGLSFTYPGDLKVEEEDYSVLVSSNDRLFSNEADGAGVAIFKGTAKNFGLDSTPQTKEELWTKLKQTDSGFREISSKNKNWLGKEWLYVEFEDTGDKVLAHFYIYLHNATVYMVGAVYHPQGAREQFEQNIEQILDSLEFDIPE